MSTSARPEAFGYYGWNIVAATGLIQAVSFGIPLGCLSLFIPAWSHDLGAPVSTFALCYTMALVLYCAVGPLIGVAADWISMRSMMTAGLFGVSVIFCLASQVTQPWQMVLLYSTLTPVALAIAGSLPIQILLARWFVRRLGLALAISALGVSTATAVFPPILAQIMSMIGWRSLFLLIAAVVALVCAPIALLVLRERPAGEPEADKEPVAEPSGRAAKATSDVQAFRTILTRPNWWVLIVVAFMGDAMSGGVLVNIAPLALNHGFSGSQAATLLSVFGVSWGAATLAVGYAIDRLSGRVVIAAIMLASVAGLIILKTADSYGLLALGVLLVASSGPTTLAIVALVAREFGAATVGRAMGLTVFLASAGVFAPPVVAFMREATHSYDTPLLVLAGMGLVALFSAFLFREHPPLREAPANSV